MSQGEREPAGDASEGKEAGEITQAEAASELCVSVRHGKQLVKALKERGDKAVTHGLRGRPSPAQAAGSDPDLIQARIRDH